jgi:hypothetical protein
MKELFDRTIAYGKADSFVSGRIAVSFVQMVASIIQANKT